MLVGSKKDKLRFSKEVAGIDIKKKILTLADGKSERFEKIVSTMPLPELVRIIINCPKTVRDKASRLRYVSVFNLNLGINRADISDKHWIYFPEKRYIFYRVGFASNFSRHIMPPGTSSIYTEVSYTKDRPLRHTHQALKKRIIGDLRGLGILTAGDEIIAEKIYDIKYAYPVHDIKRERLVSDIKYFLNQHNIYSIGRYGSWRYMTMEECILEGKYVAEILNEP
jgi:UDP-galactopyranose mutase